MKATAHAGSTAATPARVGLWGVFGHGNYGNEATLSAFLAHLDSALFAPVILTISPAEAARRHRIPAKIVGSPAYVGTGSRAAGIVRKLSNRTAYLWGAMRTARSLDSVVVVGTGGLERTGPFGTPFEIWALALGCRVFKDTFVLLDIGVDASQNPMTRYFTRTAGRWARYRSYRDEQARDNMVRSGLSRAQSDPVVTDLAFDLTPPRSDKRDAQRIVFGVMDSRGNSDDAAAHANYLDRSAEVITELIKRDFVVTLVAGDDADLEPARDLSARFSNKGVDISTASTPEELTLLLSNAGAVIATRYHTLVFGLIAGTPVVSIGYSAKHRAMLEQIGLPGRHRESSRFVPGEIAELACASAADTEIMRRRIESGTSAARLRLNEHWPHVLNHLEPR